MIQLLFSLTIALTTTAMHTTANAAVWPTRAQWTAEKETAYSAWVESNWNVDVYVDPNSLLYQIASDCADASYDMRALFAYKNGLPFRAGKFTNESKEFDKIKNEDERFRKFIASFNVYVDTTTLSADTYPIEISKDTFRPGLIFLSLKPTNHSLQIVALSKTGIPKTIESTEPAAVRKLQERLMFPPYLARTSMEGFRAFKWPEHYGIPMEKIPRYSQHQVDLQNSFPSIDLYYAEAQSILAQRPESLNEKAKRFIRLICDESRYRIEVVDGALEFRRGSENICLNKNSFDAYSTPSRDRKVTYVFRTGYNLIIDDRTWNQLDESTLSRLKSIFTEQGPRSDTWCPLESKSKRQFLLWDIWMSVLNRRLLSDPHANEPQRWGFENYIPMCPSFNST